jgi:hypothetical protein
VKFRNQEEIGEARVATLLYLPQMLSLYEEALKELGVRIVEKFHYKTEDGFIDPGFLIESDGRRFELQLGNAFKEFLSIDREESPMRFDWRINDPDQAADKLAGILAGRVELARAFIECETPEEIKKRVEALGKQFQKVRFWRIDQTQKGGGV